MFSNFFLMFSNSSSSSSLAVYSEVDPSSDVKASIFPKCSEKFFSLDCLLYFFPFVGIGSRPEAQGSTSIGGGWEINLSGCKFSGLEKRIYLHDNVKRTHGLP